MKLDELVAARKWDEVTVEVRGAKIDFVVFPWEEVKAREEDGSTHVWEYFIGFEGTAFEKVEAGEWVPFGAGNMFAGALKSDGGFQESGHRGMLFADPQGRLVYYNHNMGGEPTLLSATLSDLG